jgi:hypothetical protein
MRNSALKYTVLSVVSLLTVVILLLVPFQGFATVWGASLLGHYTALRLWDEALLALCLIGVLYLLIVDRKIRINTLSRRLVWLILIYIALNVVWGIIAYEGKDVTSKALGYGLIINLRYLIFFLVTWSVALRISRLRSNWQWVVIWPAVIVVAFGLLEVFILPKDFLKHFGYGTNTIPVTETINNNIHYLRIPSTLRGANPLGAYLIIPISLLVVLLKRAKKNWQHVLLLIGALIVLFYSFSRSAWIGAILSIGVVVFTGRMTKNAQKIALGGLALVIVLGAGLSLIYRNNVSFQNFVFHTQKNSSVKTTSNGNHLADLKSGISNVIHSPLGRGPGTAGPASVYNYKPRIAEDYFVQVGQETGWLGLALFVLINIGVGYLLWLRRDDPLALSLFASLIGITFVNLLSHAWSDDTLSYIWWGLAGVAMAPNKRIEGSHSPKETK